MILQDLLRNIVLYKGVINPYIQLVKEYFFTHVSSSYKHQHKLLLKFEADLFQKIDVLTSTPLTGTCTLSRMESLVIDTSIQLKEKYSLEQKINGNTHITLLMNKKIDISAKTSLNTSCLSLNFLCKSVFSSEIITTGSISEYTQLIFSYEIHEKREYLGEFSLTHEENQLHSFIERRCES